MIDKILDAIKYKKEMRTHYFVAGAELLVVELNKDIELLNEVLERLTESEGE